MAICSHPYSSPNSNTDTSSSFGKTTSLKEITPNGRVNINSISDPSTRTAVMKMDENVNNIAKKLKEQLDVVNPVKSLMESIAPDVPKIIENLDHIRKVIDDIIDDGDIEEEEGSSTSDVVLCKVLDKATSSSGLASYSVEIYENGIEATPTGSGVLLLADLALGSEVPKGTYIVGHKYLIKEVGGN